MYVTDREDAVEVENLQSLLYDEDSGKSKYGCCGLDCHAEISWMETGPVVREDG